MSDLIGVNIQTWTRDAEKQVGQRVQTILESPLLLSVYQRFGAGVFRRSSVFHGLERMLREHDISGSTCFEVGTWNGLTAVVLSQFFDRVVTVDIANNKIKHAIIAHCGIANIECVDIVDNAGKGPILRGLDFDFAYLDGNHAEDTELDFSMTKRCGRVLFHECWQFQSPVWSLVHSLPAHQVVHGGCGLALWDASRPAPRDYQAL